MNLLTARLIRSIEAQDYRAKLSVQRVRQVGSTFDLTLQWKRLYRNEGKVQVSKSQD